MGCSWPVDGLATANPRFSLVSVNVPLLVRGEGEHLRTDGRGRGNTCGQGHALCFYAARIMEFAPDAKVRAIHDQVDELFRHVLPDEPTLFVSDEATILDVWSGPVDELLDRIVRHYGVAVERPELNLPLWRMLPLLHERRKQLLA